MGRMGGGSTMIIYNFLLLFVNLQTIIRQVTVFSLPFGDCPYDCLCDTSDSLTGMLVMCVACFSFSVVYAYIYKYHVRIYVCICIQLSLLLIQSYTISFATTTAPRKPNRDSKDRGNHFVHSRTTLFRVKRLMMTTIIICQQQHINNNRKT